MGKPGRTNKHGISPEMPRPNGVSRKIDHTRLKKLFESGKINDHFLAVCTFGSTKQPKRLVTRYFQQLLVLLEKSPSLSAKHRALELIGEHGTDEHILAVHSNLEKIVGGQPRLREHIENIKMRHEQIMRKRARRERRLKNI